MEQRQRHRVEGGGGVAWLAQALLLPLLLLLLLLLCNRAKRGRHVSDEPDAQDYISRPDANDNVSRLMKMYVLCKKARDTATDSLLCNRPSVPDTITGTPLCAYLHKCTSHNCCSSGTMRADSCGILQGRDGVQTGIHHH